MPGVGSIAWLNDRTATEESLRRDFPEIARFRQDHLYAREVEARYQAGTVLFYRHDTWHRGRPLREGTRRLAQNMTFRKSESEWISVLQRGWAWAMYRSARDWEAAGAVVNFSGASSDQVALLETIERNDKVSEPPLPWGARMALVAQGHLRPAGQRGLWPQGMVTKSLVETERLSFQAPFIHAEVQWHIDISPAATVSPQWSYD